MTPPHKTPGQVCREAYDRIAARSSDEQAWEAAAQAVLADANARIAELEAERDRLIAQMNSHQKMEAVGVFANASLSEELDAARERIEELEAQAVRFLSDEQERRDLEYAQGLLRSICNKHFPPNPDFVIGSTMSMVLSQIDNSLTAWNP